MKNNNTNKGITLIALVITIIVMLILVGVTISMAVNGGLFEYAGRAVSETNNALKAETNLSNGKIKVDGVWYASIDDYLAGNPIQQGIILDEKLELTIEQDYDVTTSTPVTGQLTAILNEIEGTIAWSSDNEAVATVSNTGLVTAVSDGTAKVTASCVYEGETYAAECNITVEVQKITASTMQSDLASYLGQPVNYGVTYTDASSYGKGKWEIFYADGEHIYLITKGHLAPKALTISGYTGTSDFTEGNLKFRYKAVAAGLLNKTYDPTAAGTAEDPYLKYKSTNINMKATLYLLDSYVWDSYANDYAGWAIGAPTLELFVKSYNAYYPDNAVTLETPTGNGYTNPLSSSGSVPQDTYLNHYTSTVTSTQYFWLACPSDDYFMNMRGVNGSFGVVNYGSYDTSSPACRPVVCLDSDVQLTWDSTNSEYTLSRAS